MKSSILNKSEVAQDKEVVDSDIGINLQQRESVRPSQKRNDTEETDFREDWPEEDLKRMGLSDTKNKHEIDNSESAEKQLIGNMPSDIGGVLVSSFV